MRKNLNLVLIFLLTFSLRVTSNTISTILPILSRYILNFPVLFVGLLSSEFSFTSFLSSFFVNSRLSGKDRATAFRIVSITYVLSLFLFYFANQLSIWIINAISGFSMGILWPNLITYSGSSQDHELREKVLGLYSSFLSLSLILGQAIESLTLLRYSISTVFLFFSFLSIIIPILSIKIEFSDFKINQEDNKQVITSTPFLISIFNNLLYDIPFGMITLFGGIYAISQFATNYSLAELTYFFFFLSSFVTRLMFAYLVKPNTNLFKIISLNVLLTLIGLILIFISSNIFYYITALLVLGIPHGLTYSSSLLMLSRNFSGNSLNKANSYFSGTLIGLGSIGPFFMSSIVQSIGIRLTYILIIMAVIGVFCMLGIIIRRSR